MWNLDHGLLGFRFRAKLVSTGAFELDGLLEAARILVVPGHWIFTFEREHLLGVVTKQLQIGQLDLVDLIFNLKKNRLQRRPVNTYRPVCPRKRIHKRKEGRKFHLCAFTLASRLFSRWNKDLHACACNCVGRENEPLALFVENNFAHSLDTRLRVVPIFPHE